MTLVLREVGRFVLGAALWTMALVAVAGGAAAAVLWLVDRETPPREIGIAVVAGAAVAALAHRVGAGLWLPRIGGRDLPVVWAAVAAAVVALGRMLHRRRTAA